MILKHLLNGRQFSSFVLVKDNGSNSAHHLVRRIITDNLTRGNSVQIYNYRNLYSIPYEEFVSNRAFKFHHFFCDPWDLGADEGDGNQKQSACSWTKPVVDSEGDFNVIVIDSLSFALLNLSLETLCLRLRDLKALNDSNRRTQIIGILNVNLTPENSVDFNEINRLAESVVTLGVPPNTRELAVLHRKPMGKIIDEAYETVLKEGRMFEFSEKSKNVDTTEEPKPAESAPQVFSTFKLTLDEKEKESRSQVVLPYLKNANQGGKIIYEPDENDDWDNEDPDDDLEI